MSTTISLGLLMGLVGYAYRAIQPPPPKICGSSNGPPISASRVKLSDGRHLAYKEHGVPKDEAKYKIAYIHGFDSYRLNTIPLSPELAEELGIYMVSFDRPGYGESDPNPKRTEKGIALDVEELADQLNLGNKFYVLGFSMGGQATWGCLKYIPHRLAGATLVAPVINYWWPGFPADLSKEAYQKQFLQDQWTLRVAHYTPFLTYWWNTQKLFPASSVASKAPGIFSAQDLELLPKIPPVDKAPIRQQGEFESLYHDLNVGFGKWEFDPMDLENPFADSEGAVHLWHGDEDLLVPVSLQRYIVGKLPWIQYHELKGAGHLFPYADGVNDAIIKSLVLGKK
ncbi:uncharacterized protein LOC113346296 isoform X1 [Papaver somniferum]|uniref:uncharacterized protein LOC113346296 isoform X1 n=2 Tax=Papaver somniferum TaxID=3469 RepID=UPI000E702827|nr:uncharacterized protein LOC113346296 isoform X1 [Papaver somniferum]XP_026445627.1 uncharacterized protein LOC113346296 isoform X1 [Papaver somniferum]